MFRTIRPTQIPSSLTQATKSYNSVEVLTELHKMFHGKCYLCEIGSVSDIHVEHLRPHKKDDVLKFDWNNLFYSCSRCNSIKGTKENIIDCTLYDVDKLIELIPPNGDMSIVRVYEGINKQGIDVSDTIQLLKACYNSVDTTIRGISRINLTQDIIKYYGFFLKIRNELLKKEEPLLQDDKDKLIEKLRLMCSNEYPYSAFWKWSIYRDSQLSKLISLW